MLVIFDKLDTDHLKKRKISKFKLKIDRMVAISHYTHIWKKPDALRIEGRERRA